MEKLSVVERKSIDLKGEVKKISKTNIREISKSDMEQVINLIKWRTNQVLCTWWWDMFKIMRIIKMLEGKLPELKYSENKKEA